MSTMEIVATTNMRVQSAFTTYATALATVGNYYTNFASAGQFKSGSSFLIYRGLLSFDTSSLSGATITGVTLKLAIHVDNSNTDFDVQIRKYNWSAYDPIDAGNKATVWSEIPAADFDDNIWQNTSGLSTSTYYSSGALSTSWVNTGGMTYYALTSNRTGTAPSGNEYINLNYTTLNPTLVVDYTAGGGGGTVIPVLMSQYRQRRS